MAEQDWCPATVSATTSMCATQQSNPPCPTPTCQFCRFAPSATTTSASQTSSPVSSPASGTTVASIAPSQPPTDNESSDLVRLVMLAMRGLARDTAAATAPNTSNSLLPSPVLEAQNFNKRVETAIASSTALIDQARAQLAAPKTAPTELTTEEQTEAERESAWNASYQQKEIAIACVSSGNQALYHGQALATLLNDAEMGNLTVPDCDDLLTWNSNSGADAKAECTGVLLLRESEALPHAIADAGKSKSKPGPKPKQQQKQQNQERCKGLVWQNVYKSEVRVEW